MSKILLDIGGTFIKCSDGRSIEIDSNGTREEIVATLRDAVGHADEIRAAVPGPFDYSSGQFLMKHKYAAVYGEHFADLVGVPRSKCRFVHDVNCMLLGNAPVCNTAIVALGTGLGFAMYVNSQILANELGSPAVSIFNRPFRDGVLEDYASKRGVLKLYGCSDLTVKEIAERARDGEEKAARAFRQMGEIIADTISPIMSEYGIRRLLLGGQISRSSDLFIDGIKAGMPPCVNSVESISDFDNATFKGLERL